MPSLKRLQIVILCLLCATAARADGEAVVEVPRGLWETQADTSGVVFHVRTKRCGRALCGRVERVKDRRGYDTPSNAVGAKVLWEMRPQPDGSFFGEYRGPRADRYLKSRAEVAGKKLRLNACNDEGCETRVWTRIR